MRIILFFLLTGFSSMAQTIDKAKSFYEAKKYDDAKKLLTSVDEDHKDYGQAQFLLGRIAFDQDQLDDAEGFFEEAIEANDKVADYHYWYGSTLGRIAQDANTLKQGMLAPKIKDEFEKTVALDPKNIDAHWGLIEFYTQAPGFMGGSWEKAEATAKGIGKINAGEGHRALGIVCERQEKWDEAERAFIQAYKSDPKYAYNLSNFYTRRKSFEKAFSLMTELLQKNSSDQLAAYSYGKLSALSGLHLSEGEKYLLNYLNYKPGANEPSHAGANMRLAQIKEKQGKKAEARKLFETALQQDKTLKEAQEGLQRVK